jgi:hypothetical protein
MREKKETIIPEIDKSPENTCIIPFNEGVELPREVLEQYAPTKFKKDEWLFPQAAFISYNKGTLTLKLSTQEEKVYASFNITPQQLVVNCSCGMTRQDSLCLHTYRIIKRFTEYYADYFQHFLPGEEVDLAFTHTKYFSAKWEYNDISVRNRNFQGKLFQSGIQLNSFVNTITRLPAGNESKQTCSSGWVLCYMVVTSQHKRILPVIVPCQGILKKDGTEVKGFNKFLSGTEKEYRHLLTEDQVELNRICLELFKVAEPLSGTLLDNDLDVVNLEKYVSLWKQAYQLLRKEPFVFRNRIWARRYLKGKPEKRQSERITLPPFFPVLGFTLEENDLFYRFRLKVTEPGSGKLIRVLETGIAFFFTSSNEMYFLPSVRNAALAEWMYKLGPELTIFRENFRQFETEILDQLKPFFNIEMIRKK